MLCKIKSILALSTLWTFDFMDSILMCMSDEIKWKAFEYEYRPKSVNWYWAVWILAIGGAAASFLFNNILFGIFILLSAFSVSIYASKQPSLINFTLSKKGLSINDKFIPYSDLESFWIANDPKPSVGRDPNPPKADGRGKILFKAKKKTLPYIIIPLAENMIDIDEIKEYLLKYLKEVKHNEPLLQTIIEKLGL